MRTVVMQRVTARTLKVLLVEDSKILIERLSELLRHIDAVHLIGTADTEDEAVAIARREPVDVILLDLHLRRGTGFGVMRSLATMPSRPKIIVLTNYDLPEYKTAAQALGASHFLDKARADDLLPQLLGGTIGEEKH